MKVEKLVTVSLMTRAIVEENSTEEEIMGKARYNFLEIIKNNFGDNVENIEDGEECPFDPEFDKD